ncbi:MAG: DUF3667 domain-containing protein [Prevotella sp.]|nr:DUF3667 domain-containing protein [Prevotella sp.]
MKEVTDRYSRFKEWQQYPHQVAPLSEEVHRCATCGTRYEGNYCPRCGQSAKIGRYSFKNAILLYLDVWGLGNRGMFRSIRDLLLRPGYMIRDYLRGMQMAYFPPFKMYFLLLALALVIDSGLNIQGINRDAENQSEMVDFANQLVSTEKPAEPAPKKETIDPEKEKQRQQGYRDIDWIVDNVRKCLDEHSSLVMLVGLLLFSLPLWLLVRRGPAIPDLRLSECFVTMVYISNMLILYNIIPSLLCFSVKAEIVYNLLTMLLIFIPVKQLSGYSYVSTVWRVTVAFVIFCFMMVLLFAAVILAIYIHVKFLAP